ncbi:MAG: class I SAM-dependent methyltransferase, partial [Rhodospirillaceae bacterium]|nr:class I SAM-dependent methyltransferase [Rhodospirillaceae bacterium]
AGCGTGQGAVGLALQFPQAEVFAVDLSRASLAYAQHMADRLAPGRIAFAVGDLLSIDRLGREFDLIECVGVLHHMAEPAAGLAALASVLRPGGTMKLGLYSERGRAAVIAARAFAARHGFGDAPDGMRRFRAAVAALPSADPARGVVESIDFFSLDALHDLVFNVQELRFTPRGLKDLLSGAGLEFLGFVPSPGLDLAAYLGENPGDPAGRDLDRWDDFERRRPDSFAHMFVFWCRKPAAP